MQIKNCPQILCPNCKGQLFKALGKENKNSVKTSIVENSSVISPENTEGALLIRCRKCGEYIAVDFSRVRMPVHSSNWKGTSTHQ